MKQLLQRFQVEQLRLLLGCACVIGVASVFVYGILPELRSRTATLAQIESQQRQLQQRAVTETEVEAIAAEVDSLRESLNSGKGVPARQAESALLRYLQREAIRVGLRLVRISPSRERREDGVSVLHFEVEAVGSYASSAQWLEALDAEGSGAVLAEFTLSPEDNEGRKLRLRAAVQAFRYGEDSV